MIIVDPAKNTVSEPEGRKTLTLLVRRLPAYRRFPGLYPDFSTRLNDAAIADDQTDAKALNAVLAQLLLLPLIVAESEGTDTQKVFLSITGNWEELAQTVLDILYEPIGDPDGSFYLSAERALPDCGVELAWLDERTWFGRGPYPWWR